MDEQRLRRALGEMAEEAPVDHLTPHLRRRVKRRLARNGFVALAALAMLITAFPVAAQLGTDTDNRPVAPSPTTTPEPTPTVTPTRTVSPSPSETPVAGFTPPDGKIMFVSDREQGDGIYEVRSNATSVRRLLETPVDSVWRASISPDGTLVAYTVGLREGSGAIEVADLSTGDTDRIFTDEGDDTPIDPNLVKWNADGTALAFADGSGNLYRINPDGSGFAPLPKGSDCATFDFDWAPDGQRLVVSRECPDGGGGLAILDLDTGTMRPITSGQNHRNPAWSPDGRFVALTMGTSEFHIGLVEADGGVQNPMALTFEGDNYEPDWSSDGNAIVFVRNQENQQDIYVMSIDGETVVPVTDDAATDSAPEWIPEG